MWSSMESGWVCSEPFSPPGSIPADLTDRCVTPADCSDDGCEPGACVNSSHTFPSSPSYSAAVLRTTASASLVCSVFCWHQQCLPAAWTLCLPTVSTYLPSKFENRHVHNLEMCQKEVKFCGTLNVNRLFHFCVCVCVCFFQYTSPN